MITYEWKQRKSWHCCGPLLPSLPLSLWAYELYRCRGSMNLRAVPVWIVTWRSLVVADPASCSTSVRKRQLGSYAMENPQGAWQCWFHDVSCRFNNCFLSSMAAVANLEFKKNSSIVTIVWWYYDDMCWSFLVQKKELHVSLCVISFSLAWNAFSSLTT